MSLAHSFVRQLSIVTSLDGRDFRAVFLWPPLPSMPRAFGLWWTWTHTHIHPTITSTSIRFSSSRYVSKIMLYRLSKHFSLNFWYQLAAHCTQNPATYTRKSWEIPYLCAGLCDCVCFIGCPNTAGQRKLHLLDLGNFFCSLTFRLLLPSLMLLLVTLFPVLITHLTCSKIQIIAQRRFLFNMTRAFGILLIPCWNRAARGPKRCMEIVSISNTSK